jgi:hypothetical protein
MKTFFIIAGTLVVTTGLIYASNRVAPVKKLIGAKA